MGCINMSIGYIALERFNNNYGTIWDKYLQWSKLYHVTEIVSLDCSLCPSVIQQMDEEGKKYLVDEWNYYHIFKSLDWLLNRISNIPSTQILAVWNEPTEDFMQFFKDDMFEFCGLDLIEEYTRISALVNCGGFEKVFLPNDLNSFGLISDYNNAKKIQEKLTEEYPDEDHAYCDLWAIWRRKWTR